MKNNTKIRLHLSKNLFETITREILAEAKVNGGGAYTEVVKVPKVKNQKAPEVKATNKMKKMDEMSSKEKMAKGLYKEKKMDEMQVNVAEEDTLNEIDPSTIDWSAIAAGMAAIGASAGLISKFHDWWEKKHPESFKKAQGVSGALSKQAGGNAPGDKEGEVKTGKFESTRLNELRKKNKNK